MTIVENNPVPIYEVVCPECKSKIQYRKAEVQFTGYITCPVCGISVWASTLVPKLMKKMTGIYGESVGSAPSAEEMEEFWENSDPWEEKI